MDGWRYIYVLGADAITQGRRRVRTMDDAIEGMPRIAMPCHAM